MNILVLFVTSFVALIFLIAHSYFFRGPRITLNFFVFAFIWAFSKENHTPSQAYSYLKLYEFLNRDMPLVLSYFTATIGWIFTLYISWSMAEKIIGRIILFQKKIFPTLFVCSAVIISISYSIETTAINIGWWKWNVYHQTFKDLFIGGYSLRALEAWLFFTVVFLAAFFLIQCSKYRDTDWKNIFIILPFTYSWAILRIGPRDPSASEEIIGVIIYLIAPLIFSSFLSPLFFKYGEIGQGIFKKQKKINLILRELPSLMLLFMLLIVIGIDIFVLKNHILLISAIPVIFVMLLSIRKIPFYIIFILSLFILFLGKEKMIIPVLPAIVVFSFWVVSIFKIYFPNKRKYKYFIFFTPIILIVIIALNFLFFNKIRRPNIILITIDAARADHLSCYGYGRLTTPNIDKFAAEGALFLQAIAPSTDTHYSVPAIITSTYSHYHGIGDQRNASVNPLVPTLAEILSKNSYSTGLFSNGYPFSYIEGVNRGFGTFMVNGNMTADELTNISLRWLKSNGKRNFFLWIHYFEPHAPYVPPFPYSALYTKDKFNTNDKNIPIGSFDKIWRGWNAIPYIVAQNNITSVNYYISQYDGEIRFVDEQIGILLDKLKRLKLDKNTLIIITADHGESLGEHNRYFQHGGMPFDVLLRVPLVLKYEPLILKDKKITRQVSSVDIFPTILEILKIKCPSGIYGKSLLGLIQDQTKNRDPYIFIKAQVNDQNLAYSLRTEKWKLIYFAKNKKYYLYDLKNDEDELNDVKDNKKTEFKFLSKKLSEWREKEELVVFSGDMPPLNRDAIEKLKSLGYLQGGGEADLNDKRGNK